MSVRILIEKEIDKLDRGIENATRHLRELEVEAAEIRSQIERMVANKDQFILDLEKFNG
jgi:prefoldin subunit 5